MTLSRRDIISSHGAMALIGGLSQDPECNEQFPLKRPWYTLQSNMAETAGPLKRLFLGETRDVERKGRACFWDMKLE